MEDLFEQRGAGLHDGAAGGGPAALLRAARRHNRKHADARSLRKHRIRAVSGRPYTKGLLPHTLLCNPRLNLVSFAKIDPICLAFLY